MTLYMSLCQNRQGEVLVVKFQAIVGVGKIGRNERMAQWKVYGYKNVSYVYGLLQPYLSEVKLAQAQLAFERFLAYDGPRYSFIHK